VVLTSNEAIDRLSEIFVVRATSTIRGLPTEVDLGPDDGMPRPCVLNANHPATIAKGHLGDLITALDPGRLAEVCRALDRATGC
jgi:mRNA interferase MazF